MINFNLSLFLFSQPGATFQNFHRAKCKKQNQLSELCQMFGFQKLTPPQTLFASKRPGKWNFLTILLQSAISQLHPRYARKGRDRHYFIPLDSEVFFGFGGRTGVRYILNFTLISFSNLSPTWNLSKLQAILPPLCQATKQTDSTTNN